jgi:hypothetical protein
MKEHLVYELNEVMRELGTSGQSINAIKNSLDHKIADGVNEMFGDFKRAEDLREKLIHHARLHDEIYYMFGQLQKEVEKHD